MTQVVNGDSYLGDKWSLMELNAECPFARKDYWPLSPQGAKRLTPFNYRLLRSIDLYLL